MITVTFNGAEFTLSLLEAVTLRNELTDKINQLQEPVAAYLNRLPENTNQS